MVQTREINLIPCDVLLREKTQRQIWMWAGTILLITMFLSGVYVYQQRKISTVEGVIAGLSLKKLEIEEMVKQLNILQEKRDRLARKNRVINALLNKRSISLLFAALEKDMNDNVWLTSFDFEDELSVMNSAGKDKDSDTWVETGYFIVKTDRSETQKNETPKVTTVLRGMAKSNRDLARFLEQLSGSEMYSEVSLRYSREETVEDFHMVEFEIETYLHNIHQM